jgi:hypothetical protein
MSESLDLPSKHPVSCGGCKFSTFSHYFWATGVTFVCRLGDLQHVERSCHLAERNRTTVVTKGLIKSKKNGLRQRTKQMQHAQWVQGDSSDPSTGFGRKTDARKCRFDDEIVVLALGLTNDFQMLLDASSAVSINSHTFFL